MSYPVAPALDENTKRQYDADRENEQQKKAQQTPSVGPKVKELTREEREEQMMYRHGGSPVVTFDKDGNREPPPTPTPYHEGATEIGWAKVRSYLPADFPDLDPANPPAELVDLCNAVGHEIMGRYDDPNTEVEETPVPPDWDPTVPYSMDKYIDKKLAEFAEKKRADELAKKG